MRFLYLLVSSILIFSIAEISYATSNQSELNRNNTADASGLVSVAAPDSTANIFTPHLETIRKSLEPSLRMRLPSQLLVEDNFNKENNKYIVVVSPDNSQPALTVNVYSCELQQTSCLVGSFAAVSKSLEQAQQEFKQYQQSVKLINLNNQIQGYLFEDNSNLLSLTWEQDEQIYTAKLRVKSQSNLLDTVNSMVDAVPILSEAYSKSDSSIKNIPQTRANILTTAEHLQQGEFAINSRFRQTFPSGAARQVGLTGQPSIGFSWGVTDNLELTLDGQTVDNAGPVRQGGFRAERILADRTGNNFFQEISLQAKQRLWQSQDGSHTLSGVVAASIGNGSRPFVFYGSDGKVAATGKKRGIVYSLELPYTFKPSDNWQFTLSPKVAFLPDDHALYFYRLPINNSGSFGTNFGLAGGFSYQLNPRIILWGDAFVPFTGNNTIDRHTGLPTRTIAYNAGVRYAVNPRLSTDLFISNTLGNTGPLSVVTDKDYTALGIGITYIPGITIPNRSYSQSFNPRVKPAPSTLAGFSFLDGGNVRNQQLLINLQGGEQGLLTGIRYGLLDDLEIGAILSNIPGTVDESQLGFSGKMRFLHQADGDPFTLSTAVTFARSNNVLVNFVNNNRNEFTRRGLKKGGFAFANERDGELFVITLSTPMHYQFKGGSAVWLTPTLGFVQRNGLEIAGFNLGASVPLAKELDLIAEAGMDLKGDGNAFIGNNRHTVIPWTVGLRWRPGLVDSMELEAYLTNRLGSTPFDTLRVRADNDLAVGFGLVLPIQF